MSVCRQAGGEMASDGQPPAHTGHQHVLPALPVAGAQIHEEQRPIPAPQNPRGLQLQHGLSQLLHLQRGRLLRSDVFSSLPRLLCVNLMYNLHFRQPLISRLYSVSFCFSRDFLLFFF